MIRIGLASDLHLEVERAYLDELRRDTGPRSMSRGRIDGIRAYLANIESRSQTGHPELGPDLSGLDHLDLMILAGDIDTGIVAVDYAAAVGRFLGCPVVLVPGNHEFYSADMIKTLNDMRRAAVASNVALLDCDRLDLVIRGQAVAILGATLWTDYALYNDPAHAMNLAQHGLADHKVIQYDAHGFMPEDALRLHQKARHWLSTEVPAARNSADAVIVATHHAPTHKASAPIHRHSPLAPAFCSDLIDEIKAWKPDLWVWGHTHYSAQFRTARTLMASAQRGYMGYEDGAEDFSPAVIEI